MLWVVTFIRAVHEIKGIHPKLIKKDALTLAHTIECLALAYFEPQKTSKKLK